MNEGTDLAQDFSGAVATYGELVRVKYYVDSFSGADYDNHYLTASGTNSWVKGVHFPIASRMGGEDYKLLQQGRILLDDRKLFLDPSVNLSGATIKVGLGSPVRDEYSVLPDGVSVFSLQGVSIYKKAYLRLLNSGSFIGEY